MFAVSSWNLRFRFARRKFKSPTKESYTEILSCIAAMEIMRGIASRIYTLISESMLIVRINQSVCWFTSLLPRWSGTMFDPRDIIKTRIPFVIYTNCTWSRAYGSLARDRDFRSRRDRGRSRRIYGGKRGGKKWGNGQMLDHVQGKKKQERRERRERSGERTREVERALYGAFYLRAGAKRQRRVLIRTSVLNPLTRGALKTRPLTWDEIKEETTTTMMTIERR